MNILTVVFRGDLANLLYQALSLKKNWQGEKRWIIVVEDYALTTNFCKSMILPIMEGWTVDVYDNYAKGSTIGWWRQQCLKLVAAIDFASSDDVLILDAKNYLVLPSDETTFIKNKCYQVQTHDKNSNDELNWINACKFFGIQCDIRPMILTPWVWNKKLVLNTVDKFLDMGFDVRSFGKIPVTEFEAYWILNQDKINWQKAFLSDGMFGDELTEEIFLERIYVLKNKNIPIWTFHRYYWNNDRLRKINNDLLKDYGIINDVIAKQWYQINKTQSLRYPTKMLKR